MNFRKRIKKDFVANVGDVVTTAEIIIPFGYEFRDIYIEQSNVISDFINKHIPHKKALVEIRWEETSVVLRAKIDYLYEVIYLFGYRMKMIDDWILQAVVSDAQEKFDNIQYTTGNLHIN